MKTCKMGCGKMKAGGTVKKIRKMKPGGATDSALQSEINRKGIPMSGSTGTNNSQNSLMMKKGGIAKMKKGGFPDLNKDGKITKADILKGRGVIKRKGGSVKKK
jgi:hypothetical protein